MAHKPTPKTQKPADPTTLSAPEFRTFLEHFPDAVLKENNIPGYAFWGVGMALAQHIDYETGTGSRLSQRAIARISRINPSTVRKVLAFLKKTGAIEVRDLQRRNGKSSENYNFRRSQAVDEVLALLDQDYVPERLKNTTVLPQVQSQNADCAPGSTDCAPGSTDCAPRGTDCAPGSNDKNIRSKDLKNSSDESSPAHIGASPTGAPGAADRDEDPYGLDSLLEDDPAFLALVEGL